MLVGADWCAVMGRRSLAVRRDRTPAVSAARLRTPQDVQRLVVPQVRPLVPAWSPGAEDIVVRGAGHVLAITHPAEIASALHRFLRHRALRGGLADR